MKLTPIRKHQDPAIQQELVYLYQIVSEIREKLDSLTRRIEELENGG